ncbi:MAG: hypothetical protein K6T81_09770 [Alicyclobacillus macrosporangiidus]|uniref:hypothetical protein n=1 Tax=Alicyclobacillus macrosporangiidus TaxID=392015 RepID=UPI0026EEF0F3|nr:hypothetical protein [Alicyclobacillus macrosporangiidus]MCL6599017.1 hypothetical protein [Alicyclobacillus macrosporangiidus]
MAFEDYLRQQIKSLPCGELTERQRNAVLERIRRGDGYRRRFNLAMATTVAALVVTGIASMAVWGIITDRERISNPAVIATDFHHTVLDTSEFRDVVEKELESRFSAGSGNETVTTHQAAVQDLLVRWSQVTGEYGFAFISFRVRHSDYFAAVAAMKGSATPWDILHVEPIPLSQVTDSHLPIYNFEMSAYTSPDDPRTYPNYFLVCGVVQDKEVTRVRITWHDGRVDDLPIQNGVYGDAVTYPPTAGMHYGPRSIEAFNAQGKLIYPKFNS